MYLRNLAIVGTIVIAMTACKSQSQSEETKPDEAAPVAKGDAAAGKVKYDTLCASCHGPTGLGDGVAAATLNPKPKNLQATTRSDEELKKIIKMGGTSVGLSPLMVAWGGVLTDPDIDNVVAHIRTLKK